MFYTMETLLSHRSKDYFSVTASSKLRLEGSHSGETSNSTLHKKKLSPHVILLYRAQVRSRKRVRYNGIIYVLPL